MSESSAEAKISCNFCGQGSDDVAKIISGPGCFICSGCVTLSMDVLVAETRELQAYKARVSELEGLIANRPRLRPLEAYEAAYLKSCPSDDEAIVAREHEKSAYVTGLQFWAMRLDRLPEDSKEGSA